MKLTLMSVAACVAVLLPTETKAQAAPKPCAERSAIIERLEAKWGEHFAGGGMQSESSLFEVWFSIEKGTWTILKTNANGIACIMASGTNWQAGVPLAKAAGVES